jgi:hypothetical protein
MSTTQRNDAPVQAVVTLCLPDPLPIRAAILRELAESGRLITRLADQHKLDPLDALDDDVEATLSRTLDIAGTLLATIVALDAQAIFDTQPPDPRGDTHSARCSG